MNADKGSLHKRSVTTIDKGCIIFRGIDSTEELPAWRSDIREERLGEFWE